MPNSKTDRRPLERSDRTTRATARLTAPPKICTHLSAFETAVCDAYALAIEARYVVRGSLWSLASEARHTAFLAILSKNHQQLALESASAARTAYREHSTPMAMSASIVPIA